MNSQSLATMNSQSLARLVDDVVGHVVVISVFCIPPMLTFFKIWKSKRTNQFYPDPNLAAMINCLVWVLYVQPFVHPYSLFLITINGVGLISEIIYLITFFIYANPNSNSKKYFISWVSSELKVMGGIAASTLLLLHTTAFRTLIVRIVCVVFRITMYACALYNLLRAEKNKNSLFMRYSIFAGFVYVCISLAYGVLKNFDTNIAVGNELAFVQVCMYFTCRSTLG